MKQISFGQESQHPRRVLVPQMSRPRFGLNAMQLQFAIGLVWLVVVRTDWLIIHSTCDQDVEGQTTGQASTVRSNMTERLER
jgi:hypothetical protein